MTDKSINDFLKELEDEGSSKGNSKFMPKLILRLFQ